MPIIDTETVISVSDDVLATTVEDEVVVLNQATGEYQGLSGVGTMVWELAADPVAVSSILDSIETEYDDHPPGWRDEVVGFIEELVSEQLIEVVERPPT